MLETENYPYPTFIEVYLHGALTYDVLASVKESNAEKENKMQ